MPDILPAGKHLSIPAGYLLAGNPLLQCHMLDRYELRRAALRRLVDDHGWGGIAFVAEQIGKEPNYVSRMLYPPEKNGHKRIGEDSAAAITAKFPNWLENEAAAELPSFSLTAATPELVTEEPPPPPYMPSATSEATTLHPDDPAAARQAFALLSSIIENLNPNLAEAGRSTISRWAEGKSTDADAVATLTGLIVASREMGRSSIERPVRQQSKQAGTK